MKLTTEIDVTGKQYYDHLCERIIADIKKITNKKVTEEQLIDGYTYKRTVNYKKKTAELIFKVGPLIKDKFFMVTYETKDTTCMYSYDFTQKDGKNYVTYTEDNNYKKQTVGNYFSDLRRKLTQGSWRYRVMQNIELTTTYIKNHTVE